MIRRPEYAATQTVDSLDECFFYHRMELSGIGEVGSQWDLRETVDAYLGNVDFQGKRVLDIGAASGFLTFEMEKRGAEVVSFDMADGRSWNIVPHVGIQNRMDLILDACSATHDQLKNAYWFAHERLHSNAQVYYGDVYNLPPELGNFDIVFLGMILGHLRDPFQALYSASRLCQGQIIVTNHAKTRFRKLRARATFMPSRENGINNAWWSLSTSCICQMLGVLGFDVDRTVKSMPLCILPDLFGKKKCISTVAHRVAGKAVGISEEQWMGGGEFKYNETPTVQTSE